MPAKDRIVEVRLPVAEYELLKRHGLPNMTTWLRTAIRALPGGSELPPLKTAAVVERPKWPPKPLFPGGKQVPALQIETFVAATKGLSRDKLFWKRWQVVHGLYEGLRVILARGDGLKSVIRDANRWQRSGEPPHPSRELYEALFKFWDLKPSAKRWYDKKYKVSNSKRQIAKAKDPEHFLAKQRQYMKNHRARKKTSAAALEKAARDKASHDAFVSDHVTEHGASDDSLPVAAE